MSRKASEFQCESYLQGHQVTLDTLPPAGVLRWSPSRKAQVVAAVHLGLLTTEDACRRYGLTLEEFTGWQRAVDRTGLKGLRVTRTQFYRELYEIEARKKP